MKKIFLGVLVGLGLGVTFSFYFIDDKSNKILELDNGAENKKDLITKLNQQVSILEKENLELRLANEVEKKVNQEEKKTVPESKSEYPKLVSSVMVSHPSEDAMKEKGIQPPFIPDNSVFDKEDIDFDWAPEQESNLWELFQSDEKLAAFNVNSVECKTDWCRVVFESDVASEQLSQTLSTSMRNQSWYKGQSTVSSLSVRPGSEKVTYYIGREGFTQ